MVDIRVAAPRRDVAHLRQLLLGVSDADGVEHCTCRWRRVSGSQCMKAGCRACGGAPASTTARGSGGVPSQLS
jgi:hypothetical protein